ncbi:DUF2975 domain-containing protein [Solibacillus sp. MA9]|uniref:DUF2975 domain-containing protein n=1 Tax=Solibacillus palustris TaxID=2908203 RepID=A0ABS9UB39_9BACL|nr:DUF2975 domain-containing protein [Solibacillus sp. MA9]MCH7321561.1 DUF2975 domain-containing protein [Solibacillus sp. MA9]
MQKINATFLSLVIGSLGCIVLFLCIKVLPVVARETVTDNPEVAYLHYPILLGMYATAVPFFYALVETVLMIRAIERKSIFSSRILQGLNHIKYCAFVIIALYICGFFVLDYANALPPIVAVMGVIIIIVTTLVATGAAFIKQQLRIAAP